MYGPGGNPNSRHVQYIKPHRETLPETGIFSDLDNLKVIRLNVEKTTYKSLHAGSPQLSYIALDDDFDCKIRLHKFLNY